MDESERGLESGVHVMRDRPTRGPLEGSKTATVKSKVRMRASVRYLSVARTHVLAPASARTCVWVCYALFFKIRVLRANALQMYLPTTTANHAQPQPPPQLWPPLPLRVRTHSRVLMYSCTHVLTALASSSFISIAVFMFVHASERPSLPVMRSVTY